MLTGTNARESTTRITDRFTAERGRIRRNCERQQLISSVVLQPLVTVNVAMS